VNLEALGLFGNEIGDYDDEGNNFKALVETVSTLKGQCPALKKLTLDGNQISRHGKYAEVVAEELKGVKLD